MTGTKVSITKSTTLSNITKKWQIWQGQVSFQEVSGWLQSLAQGTNPCPVPPGQTGPPQTACACVGIATNKEAKIRDIKTVRIIFLILDNLCAR